MTGNQSGPGWRMTTTTRVEQHWQPQGSGAPVDLERMNIEETYQDLLMFYRPGCVSVEGDDDWGSVVAAPAQNLIPIRDTTPHTSRERKRMILVPHEC